MKYLENKKIQLIVLFSVIGVSFFITLKREDTNDILKKEGNKTVVEIIDHKVTGISETYYVKCKYYVDNQEYVKSIDYGRKFVDCYKTKKCIGKKFLAYYNKNNPKQIYVDFNNEK